jgi:hypothetical protein
MTERELFLAALERDDPTERAAFLDQACGADVSLRQRVEALLHSHERAADFMEVPVVEQLAGDGGGLDFLAPSRKPGSLGRLGHYEALEVVGRGGMGVVFRAFDTKLHRVVAIKALASPLATSSAARQRFVREARAAAAVSHEHIIAIHTVEDAGPVPYLVMQFIDGPTLQKKLDGTGQLSLQQILRIGLQIAEGLAAAHRQGLVHRDVKPANILLENGVEKVKITDFGLARAGDDASLTQSGVVAGTPMYMSPEQADGLPVDFRSDLFSLGSVLYAMCAGRPPFRAPSALAVLKRVCEETPRPIREINPELPPWLGELVARLHAKAPADRYASAREVADLLARQLAELQQGGTPSTHGQPPAAKLPAEKPAQAPPRRPRRLRVMAAAVLLALLAGLGLSEAIGITNVRGTVIRLFSPDGTLVVEVDDPGVSVSLNGEDLVISGAGVREMRLKPGRYEMKATKEGKLIRQELVTVTKDGRQVVRVSREPAPAQAAAADDATWQRSVAALPAEEQVTAVAARLKELNPGFDGTVTHTIDENAVTELQFWTDQVTDIAPVRALTRLRKLTIHGTGARTGKITDLSPLKGLTLVELNASGNRISDLTPLKGMPLKMLDLWQWTGSDLTPLKGMPLEWLNVGGGNLKLDLSPLTDLSLDFLCINWTQVTDLSPLKKIPLTTLMCANTPVADLSPLRGTKIKMLFIHRTKVTDLSPLKGLPLKQLYLDFRAERDAEVLRSFTGLEQINEMPAAEFWKAQEK